MNIPLALSAGSKQGLGKPVFASGFLPTWTQLSSKMLLRQLNYPSLITIDQNKFFKKLSPHLIEKCKLLVYFNPNILKGIFPIHDCIREVNRNVVLGYRFHQLQSCCLLLSILAKRSVCILRQPVYILPGYRLHT